MTVRRILVLNPNTDPAVTRMMVAIAAEAAPDGMIVDGASVASGARLILDPAALEEARHAVEAMAPTIAARACDGVVVAAFGDPGMEALRRTLSCPVAGLAEASMAAAAALGERFCVVTTTPELAPSIDRMALRYGHGALFAGTFCTPDDPRTLMADPQALAGALEAVCEAAMGEAGVTAIIIGGGPLAVAARSIRDRLPVRLVEPVREAVIELSRRKGSPAPHARIAAAAGPAFEVAEPSFSASR